MLQNNSLLHTATHTFETLCQLNFELLKYPLYCPYLDFPGHHLFGSQIDALKDGHFTN
jgi:hypothetical protein